MEWRLIRHPTQYSNCRVIWSKTPTYNYTPLRSSSIKEILPPFPVVKKPDDLIITFDVNLKTQVLTKVRKKTI